MLRWLRRLVVGFLVVLILALVGVGIFGLTLPRDRLAIVEPEGLDVSPSAVGDYALGELAVRVTDDGVVVADGDRVIWASPTGTAFVTAATGEVEVEEHRGYFWPQVDHDATWSEQSLDSVVAGEDDVTLAGELDDSVSWRMVLTAGDPSLDGSSVRASVEVDGADAVALVSGRSDHAGVHGFGEQFADFDLDGRLLPIIVREQGVGRGEEPISLLADLTNRSAAGDATTTYAAWASYVTDDLRGVALDPDASGSHAFAVADMRSSERVALEVWSPSITADLTAADTPADLVAIRHTGSARLADWTQHGAIVGIQGGTEEVRRRVDELRAAGTEIAGVWLQDWTGQRTTSFGDRLWWTWQLDRARYPDWEDLVADLAADDIAVTTYVNPFLVDAGPKGDPDIRNLWAEAREAGYLVARADGAPYELDQGGFDAALVDLTNDDARDWFAQVIADEVLGAGASGFMADFGEGLPFDAVLADGDAALRHNEWPRLWAETVREACALAEQPDCVTWFRSGSLGQDAALAWNGDQLVTYSRQDGMASALLGTFSAGVSGWPLVHSDVGGYTSVNAVVKDYVRRPDLLARWAELEAFGVLLRSHEGNRPDQNRQVYDADERDAFARASRVFAALEPYRRQVLAEAAERGLPAVRHGWLVAPGSAAAEVDTQFFLGEALLVAPVLEADADTVEVAFPPGEWLRLGTGERFTEGVATVDAPVGSPAAFIRADDPLADEVVRDVGEALRSR